MQNSSRLLLAMSLVALPAAPAWAGDMEITPQGEIRSGYAIDLDKALAISPVFHHGFSATRARVGLKAKAGKVWGLVQTDVSPAVGAATPSAVVLKHAFAEADAGMVRLRGGLFSTGWAIPVENEWFPYQFGTDKGEFTAQEGVVRTEDVGVSAETDLGPVKLNAGIFNGEGNGGAEVTGNKSYEVTARYKPMDGADLALLVGYDDENLPNPLSKKGGDPLHLAGLGSRGLVMAGGNFKAGPAVLGVQGGMSMLATASAGADGPTKANLTGFGGSAHVYLPKIIPVPLIETPVLRVDYTTADYGSNQKPHMRVLAGLAYEWSKNSDTMISFEMGNSDMSATTPAPADMGIAWRGRLAF